LTKKFAARQFPANDFLTRPTVRRVPKATACPFSTLSSRVSLPKR